MPSYKIIGAGVGSVLGLAEGVITHYTSAERRQLLARLKTTGKDTFAGKKVQAELQQKSIFRLPHLKRLFFHTLGGTAIGGAVGWGVDLKTGGGKLVEKSLQQFEHGAKKSGLNLGEQSHPFANPPYSWGSSAKPSPSDHSLGSPGHASSLGSPSPSAPSYPGYGASPKPSHPHIPGSPAVAPPVSAHGSHHADKANAPGVGFQKYKDIANNMNKQLQNLSAKDMEKIIETFPAADRPLAMSLLQEMSQFGNMDSFNGIMAGVSHGSIYKPGKATLADNLHYLFQKKAQTYVDPTTGQVKTMLGHFTDSLSSGSKIMLDRPTLSWLRANPDMVHQIKYNNIALIHPQGWIDGFNPFNQGSPNDLQSVLAKKLTEVKKLQKGGMSASSAMDQVINGKIRDELQKLGIAQHLQIIKNPAVKGVPTHSSLAAQISHATVHGTDVRNNLINHLKLPQAYRKLATDLLKDEGLVFSPKTLAELSAAQHKYILQTAKSKGLSADNVYYLVPHAGKSYGMVTMIHQMVNNIPSGQIITSASQIPSQSLGKSMVVLLDDVAGSGSSLSSAVNTLKGSSSYSSYAAGYNGHILVAPMVSYESADQLFAQKLISNLTYHPAKQVKSILNSPAFKNMGEVEKSQALSAIGSTGYANTGGMLAFPYMAPDNNTNLAKKAFAPLITLNGKGVK